MKRLTCDTGCGRPRLLEERLCGTCGLRLPAEISLGIKEAFHQRRYGNHGRLTQRAKAFLNIGTPTPAMPVTRIPPERAGAIISRLLGEHGP